MVTSRENSDHATFDRPQHQTGTKTVQSALRSLGTTATAFLGKRLCLRCPTPVYHDCTGRLAAKTDSNLLPPTNKLFRITAVEQHTLTIDENGIANAISTDCRTRVPNPTHPPSLASDNTQRKNDTFLNTDYLTFQSSNAHQH